MERINDITIYVSKPVSDHVKSILNVSRERIDMVLSKMELKPDLFHLCYDDNTSIVAFNRDGSIFYNVAYFDVESTEDEFFWKWFIITCHELAHNTEHYHDKRFVFTFQQILNEYILNLKKPTCTHN